MESSPAPHEGFANDEGSEPQPETTMLRFKRLTTRLFGLDQDESREASEEDQAERPANRDR